MSVIPQQIAFFNDEVGRVLDGAKIYSYEKDDENTPKTLYLDPEFQTNAPYPLEATARGIFPQVYGRGEYLFVYTDKDDVEFERRDVDAGTGSAGTSAIMFNYVAEMQTGTTYGGLFVDLVVGDICTTIGEDDPRDGITSDWIITEDVTPDDEKYFALNNGLVAERLDNRIYNANPSFIIKDRTIGTCYVGQAGTVYLTVPMNNNFDPSDISGTGTTYEVRDLQTGAVAKSGSVNTDFVLDVDESSRNLAVITVNGGIGTMVASTPYQMILTMVSNNIFKIT